MTSNDVNVFVECDEATFEKILAEAMVVGADISRASSTHDRPRATVKNVRLFLDVSRDGKCRAWMHDRFFNRTLLRLETENSAIPEKGN